MKKLKDYISLIGEEETISMTQLRASPGEVLDQVQLGKVFKVKRNGEVVAVLSQPEPTALELGAAVRRMGLY